ncbi:hypothetical protein BV22DRAFT_1052813 [Leucogyrophana mollusca]|uniref:Uncharacterized protein n=1 Tax=Leucogyrophana mollusca TaxID=85980 RepID=A0ACB8AV70_9AGAM|nr:hypothetical protein BV22DRAFT_1052813 [Leucogyrophana mollusca]
MSAANTPVPSVHNAGTSDDAIEVPSSPVEGADNDAQLLEMKRKQEEDLERMRRELREKRKREAAEKKAREAEEKRERERREAEEAEQQRQAAEAEKARADAEAAKQRQAGAASAGGSVAGSTRSAGKGKGKATEGEGETPEGTEGGAQVEVLVRLVVKCRECATRKKDCRTVFKGGKPMACEPCRKSKAKCSLLPDAERKRERAGTVASPRGGEKRKKSKIAAAIAETEKDWDSEGEHRDNRDALGALSQSMMGLTDEVREFRMDFRRGLRLLDRVAFALETLAQVETRSEHEYPTDDDAEGPVASGSGRK